MYTVYKYTFLDTLYTYNMTKKIKIKNDFQIILFFDKRNIKHIDIVLKK